LCYGFDIVLKNKKFKLAETLKSKAVSYSAVKKQSAYPARNASTFALIFATKPSSGSCAYENQNPEQATLFF
jgi:hypothetical protein